MNDVLRLGGLSVAIDTRDRGTLWPVRDVSLDVAAGETLALVGESGCGKSMTCLAVAGLLPRRARLETRRMEIVGTALATLPRREATRLRRRHVAVVFQDATNGLNPVRSIGWQVAEAVKLRAGGTARASREEAERLLSRVGMPEPARQMGAYPHQLSGGMNQRAMIALAVAGGPSLLIADEATTALDVTVQAQILALIADLQRESGLAVVFVTHDLGIVAQIADRVAVMYAGRLVETGPVAAIFSAPTHPYTAGLLASLPRADRRVAALSVIPGQVPALDAMPGGCAFALRCGRAQGRCRTVLPPLDLLPTGQATACLYPLARAA